MKNKIYKYLNNLLLNTKYRIDHNPMYMCIMIWNLFAGTYAITIGLPDIAMTKMTHYSSNLICWLMFLGGVACVSGILMGTKVDFTYWLRPLFGKTNKTDIRKAYLLGILGHPMLMISFYYYSIAVFIQMPWESTQTSEASLALAVGIGCSINLVRFILEINNINAKLPALIQQEIDMRMSRAGGDDEYY